MSRFSIFFVDSDYKCKKTLALKYVLIYIKKKPERKVLIMLWKPVDSVVYVFLPKKKQQKSEKTNMNGLS